MTEAEVVPIKDTKETVAQRVQAATYNMREILKDALGQPLKFEKPTEQRDDKGATKIVGSHYVDVTLGLAVHLVLTANLSQQGGQPPAATASDQAMRLGFLAQKCGGATVDIEHSGMVRLSHDQVKTILERLDILVLSIELKSEMRRIFDPVGWDRLGKEAE